MKFWIFACTLLALAGTFGLLVFAVFPALGSISPRAPSLTPNPGTQTLNFDEGNIRYQSIGSEKDAQVTLFLHGFNSQLSAWDKVWPYLHDCGRIIRLDIPGYGGSAWQTRSYSIPDQAKRVIAFLDTLKISRVTLIGASMGGSLSAWIAADYPERVSGLVLLAPSGYPGSLHYGGLMGKLLVPGFLNSTATLVAASPLYRRMYPDSTALQALSVTSSYGNAWAEALTKIKAPTQILWSRGDLGVPFAYAEAVAQAIPGSKLRVLSENVGHDIPNNQPELVAKTACQIQSEGHHGN